MIRFAQNKDINEILELLRQVNLVHHNGRPDIFKLTTKYNNDELLELLKDPNRKIFVNIIDDKVVGYCFTEVKEIKDNMLLQDRKELYIDDLCVDENHRRMHIAEDLFLFVKNYAKENKFDSITLNVWELNPGALKFYQKMGMLPLKTYMEYIL